jgi:uncharacterized cupin superfamily protein
MLKFTKDHAMSLEMGNFSPKPGSSTPGQQEAVVFLIGHAASAVKAGVWECTPGRFTVNRAICEILTGHATLIDEDKNELTLKPGDHFMVPKGFKGDWVIHETVRKIFVIHPDAP